MRTRRHSALMALVTSVALVAGCTTPTGSEPRSLASPLKGARATEVPGQVSEPLVEFDAGLGSVTLPADRLSLNVRKDRFTLEAAQSVLISTCAQKEGIEWYATPVFDDVDVYLSEAEFGPWTLGQAKKFGFAYPARDADLRANKIVPADYGRPKDPFATKALDSKIAAAENPEDQQVLLECASTLNAEDHVAIKKRPWSDPLENISVQFTENRVPEAAKIWDEVGDCYRRSGLEPRSDLPWFPAGASADIINTEQIAMAVTTVKCKNEVDATQRVYEIWARHQLPVINEYQSELQAEYAELRKRLSDAESIIAANPSGFPPGYSESH